MSDDSVEVQLARLQEQMIAKTLALNLATDEFHRRLDELNGEAARLKDMQNKYVPRETYEAKHTELDKKVDSLEEFRANLQGRMWLGGGIILILAAAITVAGRLIK